MAVIFAVLGSLLVGWAILGRWLLAYIGNLAMVIPAVVMAAALAAAGTVLMIAAHWVAPDAVARASAFLTRIFGIEGLLGGLATLSFALVLALGLLPWRRGIARLLDHATASGPRQAMLALARRKVVVTLDGGQRYFGTFGDLPPPGRDEFFAFRCVPVADGPAELPVEPLIWLRASQIRSIATVRSDPDDPESARESTRP